MDMDDDPLWCTHFVSSVIVNFISSSYHIGALWSLKLQTAVQLFLYIISYLPLAPVSVVKTANPSPTSERVLFGCGLFR